MSCVNADTCPSYVMRKEKQKVYQDDPQRENARHASPIEPLLSTTVTKVRVNYPEKTFNDWKRR